MYWGLWIHIWSLLSVTYCERFHCGFHKLPRSYTHTIYLQLFNLGWVTLGFWIWDGRMFHKVWFTSGWSSAVLMCESSSSAEEDRGSLEGWVCVLQDGNTKTAGRSTVWSAALHSQHAHTQQTYTRTHKKNINVTNNTLYSEKKGP